MVQIIDVNDSKWSQIIGNAKEFDFYHTQQYHLLEKKNEALLFVLNFDDGFIALPIVVREIDNTDYKDCTSVYGYCGPVSSFDKEQMTKERCNKFRHELLGFFKDRKIISAFSRLHPIINNDVLLHNFGVIKDLNKTIAIDLKLSAEDQRKQFRKSNKSEINQLRRKGYQVVEAKSEEEIDAFISIYHKTMDRVGAIEMYFFNHDYFYTFLNNKGFQTKLLLAIKDEEITAGAIFTVTNNIMQYHLAGTKETFMRETPMKLILDEARLFGNSLNLDYLHLGGGVGGSNDDSLFRFKSGFSDVQFQFRIWQLIVDERAYYKLVDQKGIDSKSESNFFPLYRSKE